MAQYGKSSYWDERYTKDPEPFDWYQRYAGIRDLINQYVKREDVILMGGCGNSRLTEDMFEDGLKCKSSNFWNNHEELSINRIYNNNKYWCVTSGNWSNDWSLQGQTNLAMATNECYIVGISWWNLRRRHCKSNSWCCSLWRRYFHFFYLHNQWNWWDNLFKVPLLTSQSSAVRYPEY